MLILYGDEFKQQVSGDGVYNAALRTTLEPVPVTLEAVIRLDEGIGEAFVQGKEIKVGNHGVKLTIIYAQNIASDIVQDRAITTRRVVALQSATCGISYRLQKAIIREKATLSELYNACGAKTAVGKDFTVARFYAFQGDVPSAQIAKVLQEEGGVVLWRAASDKVEFLRIDDLFKQTSVGTIPSMTSETKKSGFLERHEIPAYFTIDAAGKVLQGDFSSPRAVDYAPQKTAKQLFSMSQVLLNVKTITVEYMPDLNAGDLVTVGNKDFVIITAAHASNVNSTGGRSMSSTFWLGVDSRKESTTP